MTSAPAPDYRCLNCGHRAPEQFCASCGQSTHTGRIDAHYFLHDIPHSVLHVDKGLFYTLRELVLRPGPTLRDYLAGKRARHFRPFGYVVILSAAAVLVRKLVVSAQLRLLQERGIRAVMPASFFQHYLSAFIFLMIPLASVVAWVIFRRARQQYNYWEHFLANTYLAAQLNLILIGIYLFSLGKVLLGGWPTVNFTLSLGLFLAYLTYAYGSFVGERQRPRLALFSLLMALLYLTGMSLAGIMTPWWRF